MTQWHLCGSNKQTTTKKSLLTFHNTETRKTPNTFINLILHCICQNVSPSLLWKDVTVSFVILQSKPSVLRGKYVQCSEAQLLLQLAVALSSSVMRTTTKTKTWAHVILPIYLSFLCDFLLCVGHWAWFFRVRTSTIIIIQTTTWTPGPTWRHLSLRRTTPNPDSTLGTTWQR